MNYRAVCARCGKLKWIEHVNPNGDKLCRKCFQAGIKKGIKRVLGYKVD